VGGVSLGLGKKWCCVFFSFSAAATFAIFLLVAGLCSTTYSLRGSVLTSMVLGQCELA
jgi:hypothetical protein